MRVAIGDSAKSRLGRLGGMKQNTVRSAYEGMRRRTSPMVRATVRGLPHAIAASLRRAKRRVVAARFPRRVVQHIYGGVSLKVAIADPVAADWYDGEWHSQMPEVDLLRTRGRLRPGSRVFNIGAHQCVVALVLAKYVAPGGEVIAVEAGRHNVEVAYRNHKLNNQDNLTILHAAGMDAEGTITFDEWAGNVPDDPHTATDPVSVPAVTLDSLAVAHGHPDVVVMDVEGAEGLLLRGGPSVLQGRPDWFVEVHVGCGLERLGSSAAEVISFFSPADYELHIAGPERGGYGTFVEYRGDQSLTQNRFYLVCLAR
jgi:FkbM family methyltransferase